MSDAKGPNPALLDHCIQVYNAMHLVAEQTEIDGDTYYVYTGALTKLFEEQGLGQPYYTQVMRRLQDMQCVRQLQRGGGRSLSKWALIASPTKASFEASSGSGGNSNHIRDEFAQQNRDLAQRIARTEAQVTLLSDQLGLLQRKFETVNGQVETLLGRSNVVRSEH